MTAGLDTSVVVQLLIGEPEAQAVSAKRWLEREVEVGRGPVYLSDLVVSESYFALRHHYGVPHADALRALRALVADERIRAGEASTQVLNNSDAAAAQPGFMDRLIHQQYREAGLDFATFDQAAAQLPGAILLS